MVARGLPLYALYGIRTQGILMQAISCHQLQRGTSLVVPAWVFCLPGFGLSEFWCPVTIFAGEFTTVPIRELNFSNMSSVLFRSTLPLTWIFFVTSCLLSGAVVTQLWTISLQVHYKSTLHALVSYYIPHLVHAAVEPLEWTAPTQREVSNVISKDRCYFFPMEIIIWMDDNFCRLSVQMQAVRELQSCQFFVVFMST